MSDRTPPAAPGLRRQAGVRTGLRVAGARYAAGEYGPVVKDTAEYLTDGRGLRHLGVRDGAAPAAGPHCRSCGTRNDPDARYCDSCGTAMA
jgi:zinc-ribbon domain